MIEFLFLLVEILAIVYLIHNIVGVSVKVDVYLIMLLAIGLGITIAIINDLIWDKGVCIVYGLLGLYVVVELKKRKGSFVLSRSSLRVSIGFERFYFYE